MKGERHLTSMRRARRRHFPAAVPKFKVSPSPVEHEQLPRPVDVLADPERVERSIDEPTGGSCLQDSATLVESENLTIENETPRRISLFRHGEERSEQACFNKAAKLFG